MFEDGMFVTAGGRKNHMFIYGKTPKKLGPSLRRKMSACLPRRPYGVPRERCPFSVRVRGVSIRVFKSFRREASDRPSLPYPELGRVTASDTICLLM